MTSEEFWYFFVGLAIVLFVAHHVFNREDK